MNIFRFTLLILFLASFLSAQSKILYYPHNFKNAVKNETRNFSGTPGKNYWINKSDYKISAYIDLDNRRLHGSEIVEFTNNSPDDLKSIVVRLYQEFFSKGNARDFQIGPNAVTNGVKIKKILVNGEEYQIGNRSQAFKNGTNLYLILKEKLLSGNKVSIEIDWSFVIPKEVNLRMGTYDKTSFFVGHWYPQISVYDDIDGWDTGNYNGMLEFYNDFNNFDVEITMPKDFIVWGTGLLQNPEEVLSEKYYDRYKLAKYSDDIVSIIDTTDLASKGFTVDKEKLIWKFKAENVPDFAFATSDHYLWDLGSVDLDNGISNRVIVGAAYKKESKDFYDVADISKRSLIYFSEDMPGIKYPWPSMLVFNGHGGMEFPMMVNDGSAATLAGTVGVTSHEIAHTYFPFFTGTSERKWAFMDEGWAVMLPFEFQVKEGKYNAIARQVGGYEEMAGTEFDLPLNIPSSAAGTIPYRQMVYRRAGLAYWFLMDAVGKGKFTEALQEYIKRWNEKHPTPFDFYHTFNEIIDEDLDWFWKPWFLEFGAPDLGLDRVFKVRSSYHIKVDKIGNIPVPIKLTLFFDDGTTQSHYESCRVWKDNESITIEMQSEKRAVKVELGFPDIPDADKSNNKLEI